MKLPNLETAVVEQRKITTYLLSEETSGGKAAFFAMFGFTVAEWSTLRDELLHHATTHEVAHISETPHGVKYIIEGEMQTPIGRSPRIRAVWIIDVGEDAPRLVTAYPIEGGSR